MRKNKKIFITKITSLALCAVGCLTLGTLSLMQTEEAQAATTPIKQMHTLSGFKIEETAAVRRIDDLGLRFTTRVNLGLQGDMQLLLGTSNVVYGTLLLPADLLVGEELTHQTASVIDIVSDWEDQMTYTAVYGKECGVTLDESDYSRPIAARSYAWNKDTGVVYYTENTAIRSIGYVAYKAVEDGEDSEMVRAIASHSATTMELVFNESISVYNTSVSGTAIIENGVEAQSENVFVFTIGGIEDASFDITYQTANESIIAIENGVPTAKGEGKTNLTATVTVGDVTITKTQAISTTAYVPSSEYKILIPANAGEIETQAAKKLQSVVQEATGVSLPIVTESGSEKTSGQYISIGETKLAQKNCDVDDLDKETASRVKTVGKTVFIRGKIERATLYGVQQLLDDTVGYEFYLEDSYLVDEKSELIIKDKDYIPDIENEVMQWGAASALSVEHAAPSYMEYIVPVGTTDEEDANGQRYKGVAHNSMLVIKKVDKAGVEDTTQGYSSSTLKYKDWYATRAEVNVIIYKYTNFHTNGEGHKLELCYTAHGNESTINGRPALIEVVANEMFTKMRKEAFMDYTRVGFSLSDANYWCECNTCNAEGNPSDNLLHFLLDVAASLKQKLTAVGDARAETFKICTLFYNSTNLYPKNMANYQSKVDAYLKHMELWFAETGIDFVTPITDTSRAWNKGALEQFNLWTELADTYGADVLWWGYYASVRSGFIPFDSFDALRGNYAYAYDMGIDYMFNQAIGYKVNWTKLKHYLMSELRWNAKPTDEEWNGWIADYMEGAFGQGAAAMADYFDMWNAWTDANASKFTNSLTSYLTSGDTSSAKNTYGSKRGSMTTAIGYDARSTSLMPLDTLTAWLNACNRALAALDKTDKNYQIYYNNIILERLTPLYLIMYVHGGFNASKSTFSNTANVIPYAQDFLDGIALWGVTYDGEAIAGCNTLPQLTTAINAVLQSVTSYNVSQRQNVERSTNITLRNENIAGGEGYTAMLISGEEVLKATGVTALDGSVTLVFNSAPAAGKYTLLLRSTTKIIQYTDVFVADGFISTISGLQALTTASKSGYYVLTQDIVNTGSAIINAGSKVNFTGVLDGDGYTLDGLVIGANGMFANMNGATVKNITLKGVTASAALFAKTATNATFDNVTVDIIGDENKAFVGTESNVTYKNVAMTYGTPMGKTFFVAVGESKVMIEDPNLPTGSYTVFVNGEMRSAKCANGKMEVSVYSLGVGEKVTVICDNGTKAYAYSVMGITKFITTFDELVALGIGGEASKVRGNDIYGYYVLAGNIDGKGALVTHDYNWNYSHFKGTLDGNGYTVKNFTVGTCGIFGGMWDATVKNITFDKVSLYTKSTAAGWNYSGVLAGNATNVLFENVTLRFASYQAIADDNPPSIFYKGTFIGEKTNNVTYKNVTIDLSACSTEFTSSKGTVFGTKLSGLVCENVTVIVSNTSLTSRADFYGYTEGKTVTIAKPDGVTVVKG